MKIKIIGALVCLAFALPALAADDSGGPPIIAIKGKAPATLKRNPASGVLRLGKQQIFLEQTRLGIIAQRTGAEVGHRSGPDNAKSWICLTDSDLRIWLSAEDDQGDDTITGLTLARLPGVIPNRGCPSLPRDWKEISLPHGIKLDMSDDAMRAELGAPSYDQKGLVGYVYTTPVAKGGNGGVLGSSLWTAVNAGKIGVINLVQRTD